MSACPAAHLLSTKKVRPADIRHRGLMHVSGGAAPVLKAYFRAGHTHPMSEKHFRVLRRSHGRHPTPASQRRQKSYPGRRDIRLCGLAVFTGVGPRPSQLENPAGAALGLHPRVCRPIGLAARIPAARRRRAGSPSHCTYISAGLCCLRRPSRRLARRHEARKRARAR